MTRAWQSRFWALARAAVLLAMQAGSSIDPTPQGITSRDTTTAAADTAGLGAWTDCAVVGAALDQLYATSGARQLVVLDEAFADTTLSNGHVDRLNPVVLDAGNFEEFLKSLGVDENAVADFARRNALPGLACSAPHSRFPIWILHRAADRSPHTRVKHHPEGSDEFPGVITVSRAGLSADGRQAVLFVSHSCGFLCGAARLVVLHRDEEGGWRVVHQQLLWVS